MEGDRVHEVSVREAVETELDTDEVPSSGVV